MCSKLLFFVTVFSSILLAPCHAQDEAAALLKEAELKCHEDVEKRIKESNYIAEAFEGEARRCIPLKYGQLLIEKDFGQLKTYGLKKMEECDKEFPHKAQYTGCVFEKIMFLAENINIICGEANCRRSMINGMVNALSWEYKKKHFLGKSPGDIDDYYLWLEAEPRLRGKMLYTLLTPEEIIRKGLILVKLNRAQTLKHMWAYDGEVKALNLWMSIALIGILGMMLFFDAQRLFSNIVQSLRTIGIVILLLSCIYGIRLLYLIDHIQFFRNDIGEIVHYYGPDVPLIMNTDLRYRRGRFY